jgi:hypothetical protein
MHAICIRVQTPVSARVAFIDLPDFIHQKKHDEAAMRVTQGLACINLLRNARIGPVYEAP